MNEADKAIKINVNLGLTSQNFCKLVWGNNCQQSEGNYRQKDGEKNMFTENKILFEIREKDQSARISAARFIIRNFPFSKTF